ncbi:MAG: universal stress protein [Pseudomonadales bacterium]
MTKLLVPVDGSEQSSKAAEWAAQWAGQTDCTVTLLHIYDITANEAVGLASLSKEQVEEIKVSVSRASFEKAIALMGNIKPTTKITTGDPANEIISHAKLQNIDHIVMGSRGMSPVRELLLGSVSDKTIRHASCPVTIIR